MEIERRYLGQRVTLGFVFGKDFVAKGGLARVEGDDEMGRFLFGDDVENGIRDTNTAEVQTPADV